MLKKRCWFYLFCISILLSSFFVIVKFPSSVIYVYIEVKSRKHGVCFVCLYGFLDTFIDLDGIVI